MTTARGTILTWGGSLSVIPPQSLRRWGDLTSIAVPLGDLSGVIEMTSAGVLRHLRLRSAAPPLSNQTYEVRVNGVPTALTATLTVGSTTATDVNQMVSVNAGDRVELVMVSGTQGFAIIASLEFD